MKKLILMSALVMGSLSITTANAQFGIHINLRVGTRPVYVSAPPPIVIDERPVYNDDDYYYLPEVEAYYNVAEHCYYYQDGGRWISAAYLPGRYHDFDWRSAKRFEIHANRPFMRHDAYRGRFGGYMNRSDYYARAYPNRDRFNNELGRDHYDNRGNFDRHDNRNQNAYNQPSNQGGYNQPNHGSYNQPSQNQNQGGYNSQNPGRNQGGYNNNQPAQNQGQQGNHGGNQGQGQSQGNGNSQPANHNGGQNNGYTGGDHYAANKMGVVQDRSQFARPIRN